MGVPFPSRPEPAAAGARATAIPVGGVPPRGVLTELARGFLRGLSAEDPGAAQRFAAQFLTEQSGPRPPPFPARRGPLLRAAPSAMRLPRDDEGS